MVAGEGDFSFVFPLFFPCSPPGRAWRFALLFWIFAFRVFYFPSLAYAARFPFVLCSATVEVNNPKERWLFD